MASFKYLFRIWVSERLEWILASLAIVSFMLGVYGYGDARPDASQLDRIYYSFRLFLFNFDFIEPGKSNLPLELARWLAPVTLAAGLLRLAAGLVDRTLTRFLRVRKLSGHTIICGLGARGSWIARNMAGGQSGRNPCVCVELNGEADSVSELRARGVVVIEGSARDIRHLEEAGLRKAGRVVIVAGDDQNNLSIAREIHAHLIMEKQQPAIIVGVEDFGARSFFAERLRGKKIELMGFREQAALWLARDLSVELAGGMSSLPVKPPEVLIEASDGLRLELVRALGMVMQVSAEDRLVIHVCGACSDDKSRFNDTFPASSKCVDLRWHEESAESFCLGTEWNPDIAIFALAHDTASLDAADRFLCRRAGLRPARVVACLQDTGDLYELAFEVCNPLSTDIRSPRIVSLFQVRGDNVGFIGHVMDKEGRALHEVYRKKQTQNRMPDPGEWEKLSELKRNSNRLAALQEDIWRTLWLSLLRENQQEATLLHLSRCEHMRWMAFHVMAGWRPGKTAGKEEQAIYRLHDCIKPFDELDDRNKSYDLNNVLMVLGLPSDTLVRGINSQQAS